MFHFVVDSCSQYDAKHIIWDGSRYFWRIVPIGHGHYE